MSELPKSVVVCNLDGRIVLYNNRARLQFRGWAQAGGLSASAEPIGLGRSVYAVLDRGKVAHALENVERRLRRGALYPAAQFATTTSTGRLLRVHLTPVRAEQDSDAVAAEGAALISGFVLLSENAMLGPETATPASPAAATWPLDEMSEEVLEEESLESPELSAPPQAPSTAGIVRHDSRPEYYPENYDFALLRTSTLTQRLEDRPLAELAYTVFDTETTGLEPSRGDEILQLGAVRIVNGRVLARECFDQLVDPGRGIPAAGIAIHGITAAMVRGQPGIAEVLPAFHAFCGDTVLVAHNAAFDLRFLELKQAHAGVVFDQPVLDTLLLSAVVHEHQRSHRLEAIAERFGLQVTGRHTAIGDALLTAEIFLRLVPLLASRGIVTLGQALEASRQTYFARQRY
jgi:DNA polymerase III epsilon subunit family exonuclease